MEEQRIRGHYEDSVNFFVEAPQNASGLVRTRKIVVDFIRDYKNKPEGESNVEWLNRQFAAYPELWKSDEERRREAKEIVDSIERFEIEKQNLDKHLEEGHSSESYMATKIEQGAKAAGVISVGQYAGRIENAIDEANQAMLDRITTTSGGINANPQLKGFIMETDHVNTFNIDAAAKESLAHARTNNSYGSNSVDITVQNPDGTWHRYQVKCGKDAAHTNQAFENGNYNGQQKLVSNGQVKDVPNSVDHLQSKDGVRSTARTSKEYENKQNEIQSKKDPKKIDPGYDWNGVDKVIIAERICRKAAWAGVLSVGFQGARILGRRIWNTVTGQDNPRLEEDLKEFTVSALQSGTGTGLVVAMTGGITVAVKSGWLGTVLKATPVGWIANSVCVGIENLKVLWKYGKGEMSETQAINQAIKTTTSFAAGLASGTYGGSVGAAIGTVLGPVGTIVGGTVGSVVGYIGGSVIGNAVYEGAKKIVSAVGKACSSIARGICSFAKNALRGIVSLFA